jgi:hypothetical protein
MNRSRGWGGKPKEGGVHPQRTDQRLSKALRLLCLVHAGVHHSITLGETYLKVYLKLLFDYG